MPRNFIMLMACAILIFGASLTHSNVAQSKSLLEECNLHSSRAKVLACCQVHVRLHKAPLWMHENNLNCPSAVVCLAAPKLFTVAGLPKKPDCYLQVPSNTQGSGPPPSFGRCGANCVSDIRLKHGLNRLGITVYGLPLYAFSYNDRPGRYEGVMAQDVLKVMPEAVTMGADGYYRVNYDMLGIEMKQIQ